MSALRAIQAELAEDHHKPEAYPLAGVVRDTVAGADQNGAQPHYDAHPSPPHHHNHHHRYRAPPHGARPDAGAAAEGGGRSSRASSVATGDGLPLPEPLGLSEMSPVLPGRAAGRMGAVRQSSVRQSGASFLTDRQRQLALLGPARPPPAKIWKRRFVKLLVVGDSGLGKTTLISSLLNTAHEMVQVHDGTGTSLAEFKIDPESLVTSVSWKDEDAREVWLVRVQDTPGYGDDPDIQVHINMILDHVRRQNERWLELESANQRLMDMSEVDDPRIDACIYCLPPHRLRPNDVRYMSQLGKLVPIVPVVMKADTMTINEAQRFRQEVANKLQNPDARGVRGRINTFGFSSQSLERAGLEPGSPEAAYPFVIIASNDVNQAMLRAEQPVYWPQRAYKWGTAEAFNSEHSDLLSLRALLLSEALEELVAAKRQRYEEWRRAALKVPLLRRLRRRAVRLALATLLPAGAVAFAATHEFDREKMGDALTRIKGDVFGRPEGRNGDAAAGARAGGGRGRRAAREPGGRGAWDGGAAAPLWRSAEDGGMGAVPPLPEPPAGGAAGGAAAAAAGGGGGGGAHQQHHHHQQQGGRNWWGF